MYRVMIVEDDPMVASINRRFVEATEGFQVLGCMRSGQEALEFLKKTPADLVILDYYMPGMNGDVFLDRMREMGMSADVIMVTSANSVEVVRGLVARGVRDYLVKPFEMERFQAALSRFRAERELFSRDGGALEQAEIDRLFDRGEQKARAREILPKGMNRNTMDLIKSCLRKHPEEHLTCEEISGAVGLSRITVRRYLNYLVEQGTVQSRIDYQTGGRPGIEYRLVR